MIHIDLLHELAKQRHQGCVSSPPSNTSPHRAHRR